MVVSLEGHAPLQIITESGNGMVEIEFEVYIGVAITRTLESRQHIILGTTGNGLGKVSSSVSNAALRWDREGYP